MEMMDRIKSGTQYRNLVLEIRDTDSTDMVVEGYATTFNQPYELYRDSDLVINEQVDARAFDEANTQDVIFQMNHEGRVYARTRNNTLEITPDEKGLFIKADLSGTEEGRKLYEEIKGGYLDRMSFGFTVAEDRTEKTAEEPRTYLRTITKIGRLFDVSAVSIPANDFTEISARSYVDGILDKEKADALAAEQRRRQIQRIRILMEVSNGN
jgi:HK97 family phage prohead protease